MASVLWFFFARARSTAHPVPNPLKGTQGTRLRPRALGASRLRSLWGPQWPSEVLGRGKRKNGGGKKKNKKRENREIKGGKQKTGEGGRIEEKVRWGRSHLVCALGLATWGPGPALTGFAANPMVFFNCLHLKRKRNRFLKLEYWRYHVNRTKQK